MALEANAAPASPASPAIRAQTVCVNKTPVNCDRMVNDGFVTAGSIGIVTTVVDGFFKNAPAIQGGLGISSLIGCFVTGPLGAIQSVKNAQRSKKINDHCGFIFESIRAIRYCASTLLGVIMAPIRVLTLRSIHHRVSTKALSILGISAHAGATAVYSLAMIPVLASFIFLVQGSIRLSRSMKGHNNDQEKYLSAVRFLNEQLYPGQEELIKACEGSNSERDRDLNPEEEKIIENGDAQLASKTFGNDLPKIRKALVAIAKLRLKKQETFIRVYGSVAFDKIKKEGGELQEALARGNRIDEAKAFVDNVSKSTTKILVINSFVLLGCSIGAIAFIASAVGTGGLSIACLILLSSLILLAVDLYSFVKSFEGDKAGKYDHLFMWVINAILLASIIVSSVFTFGTPLIIGNAVAAGSVGGVQGYAFYKHYRDKGKITKNPQGHSVDLDRIDQGVTPGLGGALG